MRTFAQEPKTTQQTTPTNSVTPGRARFGQSHEVNSTLHLPRAIGNQATWRDGEDSAVPPAVREVLRSSGQPLEPSTRSFMESRFGHDFSRVRVHADTSATESARAINAKAFTVGQDIVFKAGEYAPHTHVGQHLLAHELTHVIQQGGQEPVQFDNIRLTDPGDISEHEADHAASAVSKGQAFYPQTRQGPVLARQVDGQCGPHGPCGTDNQCASPDPNRANASNQRTLEVNLDTEAASFQSACTRIGETRGAEVPLGHAFVRFIDPSGNQFTYGFYPRGELPNQNRRNVPGCVVHPDTTHDACVDLTVRWQLDEGAFNNALTYAQEVCRTPGSYGDQYTCTSFVTAVAQRAGQSLPSSRGTCSIPRPFPLYNLSLTADNPNTMAENLLAPCERPYQRCVAWARGVGEMTPPRPGAIASRMAQCESLRQRCQEQRNVFRH